MSKKQKTINNSQNGPFWESPVARFAGFIGDSTIMH
jgi:hypothetical protein